MAKINLTVDIDKKTWKEDYNQAISDLQTIEAFNANPALTQAALQKNRQACIGLATILRKTLKMLKKQII